MLYYFLSTNLYTIVTWENMEEQFSLFVCIFLIHYFISVERHPTELDHSFWRELMKSTGVVFFLGLLCMVFCESCCDYVPSFIRYPINVFVFLMQNVSMEEHPW